MAAWLLILAITASVPVHIIFCGSIHINTQNSFEGSCKKDPHHEAQSNKGPAEALFEDFWKTLREAKIDLANPYDYPPNYDVKNGEEFDFIVVGAGSAGAVVVNRLSEEEDVKVLLVEAGGNPPKASEIPILAVPLQDTDVDWQYKTDPEEENCLGMVGHQCKWPRGKVLGGSSTINYMMHTRGHPKDFDGWAAAGNKGWSYDDVLPYFKKSEDLRIPEIWTLEGADKYHNSGGLFSVEQWPESGVEEVVKNFAGGFEELGYPYNFDINGKNMTGFTTLQGALKDYRRCSTAEAFLSPARERRNVYLSKNSLATKILIDNKDLKAYGLRLINKAGKKIEVRARKEVIVSAGAINSPQLLMLSGIGPRQHLEDLGIPVVKDLPVGQNLQDHPLMKIVVITVNSSVSTSAPSINDTFNFLLKRPNRLSSLGSFPNAAFVNILSKNDYPDVEILQNQISKNDKQSVINTLSIFNSKESIVKEFIKINKEGFTIIMLASLLRPYSRGSITLQNTDPLTHPKIIAGYFTDKRDVEMYLGTYDFISMLVETESLKRMGAKLHEVRVPSCEKHAFASSAYRECAMRHLTGTTYHYSGTCKMGPSGDPTAVVDDSLRVYGIKGLRVVDASVMPNIVSAHINAAVMMIGEKAADLIKKDWKGV